MIFTLIGLGTDRSCDKTENADNIFKMSPNQVCLTCFILSKDMMNNFLERLYMKFSIHKDLHNLQMMEFIEGQDFICFFKINNHEPDNISTEIELSVVSHTELTYCIKRK